MSEVHANSKKIVCRLTEFEKLEDMRISRKTLNLLENGGHRIIFNIVTVNEDA